MSRPALFALCLAAFIGCGKSPEPAKSPDDKTGDKTKTKKTVAESKPKKKVIPLADRRYGGKSHEEWAKRIKDIDPDSVEGREAVDGLAALIADEEVPAILRRRAAMLLGDVGRAADTSVPALTAVLKKHNTDDDQGDEEAMAIALKALMLLGPVAKEATPQLIAILENRYRSVPVRRAALEALARIGKAEPKAIGAVIQALTMRRNSGMSLHDWYALRGLAADGIALIGPKAGAAIVTLLRQARRASDVDYRRKCVTALGALKSKDAVIPLADVMAKDDAPSVREAALKALANLGPLSVSVLRKLLKHDDKIVAANAAKCLSLIGPPASEAIDDLDFALDEDDPWLRIYAAEALWRITGKPTRAIPALIEELESPQRQVRMHAYRLFKELGPKAKTARVPLEKLLEDKRGYVRAAASKALRAIQAKR